MVNRVFWIWSTSWLQSTTSRCSIPASSSWTHWISDCSNWNYWIAVPTVEYQSVAVDIPAPKQQEVYTEYIPFERTYYEQVPVQKIEYVPVEKAYTDYYPVEKVVEYVPQIRYETVRDMVPQETVEYVPQTTVECVPVVTEELVPVERYEEKIDYQPVERSWVRYPDREGQFIVEAEKSGRIRRDLVRSVAINPSLTGRSQVLQGQSQFVQGNVQNVSQFRNSVNLPHQQGIFNII